MNAPTLDRAAELRARGEEIAAKLAADGISVCPDCIGPLHPDGECRGCASGRDPAYGAYCAAINRAEDCEAAGLPYPDEAQNRRDELTMRRYELAGRLSGHDARTSANGCALCGSLERGHSWGGWVFESAAGHVPVDRWVRHNYLPPADSLRLMRLRARRFAADSRMYLAVAQRFESLGGAA